MLIAMRPKQIIGQVELFHSLPDGSEQMLACSRNDVVYEGFDVLAEIMSGNLDARINAMYFKFDSTGAASPDAVSKNIKAADFHALSAPFDYVRAGLNVGDLGRSDVVYHKNRATFVGMVQTDAKGEETGLKMTPSSVITLVAMVVSPDAADRTKDRVYAAWAPTVATNPLANSGIGMRWSIQFAD